jgi:hypothetical protein
VQNACGATPHFRLSATVAAKLAGNATGIVHSIAITGCGKNPSRSMRAEEDEGRHRQRQAVGGENPLLETDAAVGRMRSVV